MSGDYIVHIFDAELWVSKELCVRYYMALSAKQRYMPPVSLFEGSAPKNCSRCGGPSRSRMQNVCQYCGVAYSWKGDAYEYLRRPRSYFGVSDLIAWIEKQEKAA